MAPGSLSAYVGATAGPSGTRIDVLISKSPITEFQFELCNSNTDIPLHGPWCYAHRFMVLG